MFLNFWIIRWLNNNRNNNCQNSVVVPLRWNWILMFSFSLKAMSTFCVDNNDIPNSALKFTYTKIGHLDGKRGFWISRVSFSTVYVINIERKIRLIEYTAPPHPIYQYIYWKPYDYGKQVCISRKIPAINWNCKEFRYRSTRVIRTEVYWRQIHIYNYDIYFDHLHFLRYVNNEHSMTIFRKVFLTWHATTVDVQNLAHTYFLLWEFLGFKFYFSGTVYITIFWHVELLGRILSKGSMAWWQATFEFKFIVSGPFYFLRVLS